MRWSLWLVLALGVVMPAHAEIFPASIDDCTDDGPPRCYEQAARRSGKWEIAERRLRQRLSRNHDDETVLYALGQLLADRDQPGAEKMWRAAAARCRSLDLATCEAQVALSRSEWAARLGRLAESEQYLATGRAAAGRSGNKIAQLMAEVQSARLESMRGRTAEAVARLEALEPGIEQAEYDEARSDWLGALAVALWGVGRLDDSLARFQALRALHERRGDRFQLSQTLHNLVLLMSQLRRGVDSESRELLEQALTLALESGNRRSEISIRLSQAQDPARPDLERVRNLDLAMQQATATSRIEDLCFALRLKSQYAERDKPAAQREAVMWAERGVACAEELGSPFHLARAHLVHAQRLWDANLNQQGIAVATVALDSIERIRDLQPDSMSRAGTFGRWVFFYERFIGSVLRDLKSPSFESIELALTIAERRRARALLDQLDAAGGTERVAQRHPSSAPRTELLLQASDLQRQLAASSLTATERSSLRQALDKTEVRAAALAREIAATDAAFSSLRLPSIPRLSQLQGALATDEALLVYLVPETLQYGSRPRVFVITRSTARVETLALESIEQRVELFEHLLQRRDNSDIPAAQRLYRELLAVPLASLSPQVNRLTIVPDGAIARLPWGALRDEANQPLATRLTLALAPSASVWFSWREHPATVSTMAMVFSDPVPPEDARGQGLPRLPSARAEAMQVTRLWGSRSQLFAGHAASEQALRRALGASTGLVHIAAHTVIDERHPDRSAIALTPGGGEDGWLDESELVGLNLKDRCIVLSSCAGAGGAELEGEGTLSLARASFLGGARAVVAAAAPIRDDEARRVMEPFFRGLADGLDVSTALTYAQRERFVAGDTTYGWSSVAIYGDSAWRMKPVDRPTRRSSFTIVLAGFIAICGLTFALNFHTNS
ncbi:MAG: CHAT domain-containing protein [Acidobacteriota bacterium]